MTLKGLIKSPRNLVIDTVPLLLILVGSYNPEYISRFKRLSTYSYAEDDFEILREFILGTHILIITPGVLAEISNFLENDVHFTDIIDRNIDLLLKIKESYTEKVLILQSKEFVKLAFTDTSLIFAAKNNGASILTRERTLWGYCNKLGITAYHLDDILSQGRVFKVR